LGTIAKCGCCIRTGMCDRQTSSLQTVQSMM
jgi:hypothetical protein